MIRFTVFGEAQPSGSKRPFMRPGMCFPVVVDANPKAKVWKESVAREAARTMNGAPLLEGPLVLDVTFYRVRPKGHFGKHGLLPSAPSHPTTKPDRTKLLRGLEDALTGIVWRDDAQVCGGECRKEFGERAMVEVQVQEIREAARTGCKPTLPDAAYRGSC